MITEEEEEEEEDGKTRRLQCMLDNMASRSDVSRRVSSLRKDQLRLQKDRTAELRRVEEAYDKKLCSVSDEIAHLRDTLIGECLAKAKRDRQLYIEQWTASEHYVFRENPFYEGVDRQTIDDTKNSKKRSLTTECSSSSSSSSSSINVTTIDTLLALPQDALSTLIFLELGPMELLAVYRTSHGMRRVLQRILPICIRNCMARIHSDQPESVVVLVCGAMDAALNAYDILCKAVMSHPGEEEEGCSVSVTEDRRHVIPELLSAAFYIESVLSSLMIVNPRTRLEDDVLLDPSRTFVLSPSQLDDDGTSNHTESLPRFPYITPLTRCNIFYSDQFSSVYTAVCGRHMVVYGHDLSNIVAENPFDFFEYDDWMALDLRPISQGEWARRGQLFEIDPRRGTIKALGGISAYRNRSSTGKCVAFSVVTTLPHRRSFNTGPPPPRGYFIDHCVVRHALRGVMRSSETETTSLSPMNMMVNMKWL